MKKHDFEFNVEQIKRGDKKYLEELQLFFDKADRIKDEELRAEILRQMHLCENRLVLIFEEFMSKLEKA